MLNLSTAVVNAGEEAWRLLAPALEGDREGRDRLRVLSRPGIQANRRRRGGRRSPSGPERREERGEKAGRAPSALPEPRCEGTEKQRAYLSSLIRFVRATSGYAAALPEDVQIRISRRMTSKLGSCTWVGASRRITISERLFRPGLEDVIWETVKHELAHLAHQVTNAHGRTDHGPQWKSWARRLGARPERLCTPEDVRRIEAAADRGADRPLRFPDAVGSWIDRGSPMVWR